MQMTKKNLLFLILFFILPFCFCVDYNVGPSQEYTTIGAVPWTTLEAGDRVRIHYRDTPYAEKFIIARSGTADDPIIVEGVPNSDGVKPTITGEDAVVVPDVDYWNEPRGLIKIGGSNKPADSTPEHIKVSNLRLEKAHKSYTFTNCDGGTEAYADNAAGVYIEKAKDIVLDNLEVTDNGNGIFIGINGGLTERITIQYCYIWGNGNVGSYYEHNTYTSALGIVYQYNRFGALREGADGNNLKDRSAGIVIRYNWIENGNRQLDLVDCGDETITAMDVYGKTYVYGNVLRETTDDGNQQMIHYGGDSGTETKYRKGTLYLYYNTIVSTRSVKTNLLNLSTNDETCDMRNNIVYESQKKLSLLNSNGILNMKNNHITEGYVNTFNSQSSFNGQITDEGTITEATDCFVDVGSSNYFLKENCSCIGAATGLASGFTSDHQITNQYVEHLQSLARKNDLDLGAFAYDPNQDDSDGGNNGDDDDDGDDDDKVKADDDDDTTNKGGIAAGIIVGVLMLFLIVFVLISYKKNGKSTKLMFLSWKMNTKNAFSRSNK
ncbi:hypothetical protein M0812_25917 [Anaeramoeba flamelloides]|uniref:Right handed beta helix domain-containing protein n=1 Tax=Anaeramoeba flamelloides TaxID=1746091 RepID=A0AAV7YH65_9EUKA|nr:hypothetical protein M0812_25917 [Anaeramoeba flamelloides]